MAKYPRPSQVDIVYNLASADCFADDDVLSKMRFFQSVKRLPQTSPEEWMDECDAIRDGAIGIVREFLEDRHFPPFTSSNKPFFIDPPVWDGPPFLLGRTLPLHAHDVEFLDADLVNRFQVFLCQYPLWRIRWSGEFVGDVLIYPDVVYVDDFNIPLEEALNAWRSTIADGAREDSRTVKLQWLKNLLIESVAKLTNTRYELLGVIRGLDEWQEEPYLSVWLLCRGRFGDFVLELEGLSTDVAGKSPMLDGMAFPVTETGELGVESLQWPDNLGVQETLVPCVGLGKIVICERKRVGVCKWDVVERHSVAPNSITVLDLAKK